MIGETFISPIWILGVIALASGVLASRPSLRDRSDIRAVFAAATISFFLVVAAVIAAVIAWSFLTLFAGSD